MPTVVNATNVYCAMLTVIYHYTVQHY